MLDFYWLCFVGGTIFAVLIVLFDTVLGGWIDSVLDFLPDFVHPILLVGGAVAFGGAGILLSNYTGLSAWTVAVFSLLIAVALAVLLFFFYVKPMNEAESSIAYSITELAGKIGEVTVPVPENGFGEVEYQLGHGRIHAIANSIEKDEIKAGERVVTVEVKDGVVTVCRWEEGR